MTPKPPRFFVGQAFADRLKDTVRKVEAAPLGGGPDKIPVWSGSLQVPSGSGSSMKLGTYNTGATQWEKGQVINVHAYEIQVEQNGSRTLVPKYSNGSPVTEPVLNLFVTIPPNYDRVRYCAYSSIDGVNVLTVAEC